ncbi:AfsR/SARP family transcriptional regulator [Streptantibioticus ferralitis]|uniref:BTAD domain-containing putative transcriptional regulator n=1 Tax=Streptantibioticus ferralitis TaxID=236510 RepID=A0ABT5YVL2_9ACTN|nr:BTAD domain-containing putative transcriptional regulator [Streptantibioticus ferralitis]MDF2255508.1 BTAD domain-containing putative transcriptional regulator [Streptantibioticus ferralitis]
MGLLEMWCGQERLGLSGRKRQTVLGALLLAHGESVSLNRLMDTVWEHRAPVTAAKQIRNVASDLRKIHPEIAERLTLSGDGYRLAVDGWCLDARVFTERVARAREHRNEGRLAEALEEFRAALLLWRGPALAGLESPALRAQIAGLEEMRLAAMEERVELELAQGNHESVVGDLSAWVAENRLRERLVAQLMLALYRSGAQARALTVYEETRRILKDELGVNPGVELQELHRRILQSEGRPSARSAPVLRCNSLPISAVHFTGRSREMKVLSDVARSYAEGGRPPSAAPAVLAIDGMAGIGKTTLSVHAAHEFTPLYPDAQLFVDMGACAADGRPLDPGMALGTLLAGLGFPPSDMPEGLEERSATWRRLLADRRTLILLDNVADTQQILPLLPGVPSCLTIVTSRTRLTDLIATCHLTLREMTSAEGRDLFCRMVGDNRVAEEREAVDTVVDVCGRLPLAIRLAAAKLRHRASWSVAYLASRLARGRQRLATLEAEDGGLIEVFRQSYAGLSRGQQRIFRLLGQMPGDHIETRNVAGLARISLAQADTLLESLVDAHLLATSSPGRYVIHELLHAYAGQLAAETAADLGQNTPRCRTPRGLRTESAHGLAVGLPVASKACRVSELDAANRLFSGKSIKPSQCIGAMSEEHNRPGPS